MAQDWLTYQDPMSVPSNESVEQMVFSIYDTTVMLFM